MFPKGVVAIVKESTLRTESRDRELPQTNSDKSKSSGADPRHSRSSSAELKEGIAYLADDLSELRQDLEKLREEVRQDDVSELRQALGKLREEVRQLQVKNAPLPDQVTEALLLDRVSTLAEEVKALKLEPQQAFRRKTVTLQTEDLSEHKAAQEGEKNTMLAKQEESPTPTAKIDYPTIDQVRTPASDVLTPASDVTHSTSLPDSNCGIPKKSTTMTLKRRFERRALNSGYQFNSSVYDSAVVIFSEAVYLEDSFLIILSMLISIVIQLTFCILCSSSAFIETKLPTEEAAQRWRFEVGHDIENLNSIRGTSLTSRVCSLDRALSASYAQATVLGEIQYWLEPLYLVHIDSGFVMTCLAVSLWVMSIQVEVIECLKALIVYAGAAQASRMTFSFEATDLDNPRLFILTMQPYRIFFLICVTLIRLGVAILIGISGVRWLGNTVSLSELVLNCVSLVFILDVDELLCNLTLSREVKWVLDVLQPLPNVFRRRRWMRSAVPLGVYAFLAAVLIIFIHTVLLQTQVDMLTIEECLCGGNKDFVILRQQETQMFVFTQTNEASQNRLVPEDRLQQFGSWIVEGIVNSGTYNSNGEWQQNYSGNMNVTYIRPEDGVSPLQALSIDEMELLTDFWGLWIGCNDEESFEVLRRYGHLDSHRERLQRLRTLEVTLGMTNTSSCFAFKKFCDTETLPMLRTMCPQTCGCQLPRGGLFYGTARSGCPDKACRDTPEVKHELAHIPCRDPTPAELEQMPGWKAYWWTAFDYVGQRLKWALDDGVYDVSTGLTLFTKDLHAEIMMLGCEYLKVVSNASAFCQPTIETTTVAAFCPESCGCETKFHLECPHQCGTYLKR